MDALWTLLAVAATGVTYDWRPIEGDPAGGVEYLVQVEPEMLQAATEGEIRVLESNVPEGVGPIRRVRVVLGGERTASEIVGRSGSNGVEHSVLRPAADERPWPQVHTVRQGTATGQITPYTESLNTAANQLEYGFQQAGQSVTDAQNTLAQAYNGQPYPPAGYAAQPSYPSQPLATQPAATEPRRSLGSSLVGGVQKIGQGTKNVIVGTGEAVKGTFQNLGDGVRAVAAGGAQPAPAPAAAGSNNYVPFSYGQSPPATTPVATSGATGAPVAPAPTSGFASQPLNNTLSDPSALSATSTVTPVSGVGSPGGVAPAGNPYAPVSAGERSVLTAPPLTAGTQPTSGQSGFGQPTGPALTGGSNFGSTATPTAGTTAAGVGQSGWGQPGSTQPVATSGGSVVSPLGQARSVGLPPDGMVRVGEPQPPAPTTPQGNFGGGSNTGTPSTVAAGPAFPTGGTAPPALPANPPAAQPTGFGPWDNGPNAMTAGRSWGDQPSLGQPVGQPQTTQPPMGQPGAPALDRPNVVTAGMGPGQTPADPTGYAGPKVDEPWFSLAAATLVSFGSIACNFFLGWSYLDARNKYQTALRRTVRPFTRGSAEA